MEWVPVQRDELDSWSAKEYELFSSRFCRSICMDMSSAYRSCHHYPHHCRCTWRAPTPAQALSQLAQTTQACGRLSGTEGTEDTDWKWPGRANLKHILLVDISGVRSRVDAVIHKQLAVPRLVEESLSEDTDLVIELLSCQCPASWVAAAIGRHQNACNLPWCATTMELDFGHENGAYLDRLRGERASFVQGDDIELAPAPLAWCRVACVSQQERSANPMHQHELEQRCLHTPNELHQHQGLHNKLLTRHQSAPSTRSSRTRCSRAPMPGQRARARQSADEYDFHVKYCRRCFCTALSPVALHKRSCQVSP